MNFLPHFTLLLNEWWWFFCGEIAQKWGRRGMEARWKCLNSSSGGSGVWRDGKVEEKPSSSDEVSELVTTMKMIIIIDVKVKIFASFLSERATRPQQLYTILAAPMTTRRWWWWWEEVKGKQCENEDGSEAEQHRVNAPLLDSDQCWCCCCCCYGLIMSSSVCNKNVKMKKSRRVWSCSPRTRSVNDSQWVGKDNLMKILALCCSLSSSHLTLCVRFQLYEFLQCHNFSHVKNVQ